MLKCVSCAHLVLLLGLVTILHVPYSCAVLVLARAVYLRVWLRQTNAVLSLIFMGHRSRGYVRETFISACLAVAIGYQNFAYHQTRFSYSFLTTS